MVLFMQLCRRYSTPRIAASLKRLYTSPRIGERYYFSDSGHRKVDCQINGDGTPDRIQTLGWEFVLARDQTESWAKEKELHTGANRQIKAQPSEQSKQLLLQHSN